MKTNGFTSFLTPVTRQSRRAGKSLNHRLWLCWLLTLTLLAQTSFAQIVLAAAPARPLVADNGEKDAPKTAKSASAQINRTPVTTVSAATYEPADIAPNSIVAAFGTQLATGVASASMTPLPTTLAGTTVKVKDSAGGERLAPLFFVSPAQINYLIPGDSAIGAATVTVQAGNGIISEGTFEIVSSAPAIFTANQDGRGVPAANLLRVQAGGTQVYESPAQDGPGGRKEPRPIDLGPAGERVFLVLYLTGISRVADPNNDGNLNETMRVIIGGNEVAPVYAGVAPGFEGLEQINVELPRALLGRGRVNVAVAGAGVSASNVCEIEIAGVRGSAPPQITSVSAAGGLPGQELTINGSGFSAIPGENLVRVGGVEASVTSAAFSLIKAIIPFGAESGPVFVRTPQGEAVSANPLPIRASLSGFVETTTRQPLSGVAVRLLNTSISATTDAEGLFLLPDAPVGPALIEIDASASPSPGDYPKIIVGANVTANRNNQILQPIALQRIGNATVPVPSAGLANNASLTASEERVAAVQSNNVVFDIPISARASFPDGSTSGALALTVVANARTPVNLPARQYSSTIAQITPFGATLDVGGKLSFPNPEGLVAGAQARLYRLDQKPGSQTVGMFVEVGFATVSADGQRVETLDGAITETGYYFVSAARPTSTVIGRVVEAAGNTPVRRVLVGARGQSVFTDGNGGFILRNIPARSGEQITVEASYARPRGRLERAQRDNAPVAATGITKITPDIVLPGETSNRPPVLLAPTSVRATAGQTTEVDFTAMDLDAGQTVQVAVTGATFASVVSRSGGAYALRLAPAADLTGDFTLVLTATDNANASATQRVAVNVVPPPPSIASVNPTSARIGETVTLTGVSLKFGAANPQVAFPSADGRRIKAMVTMATPTEVKVVVPNGADSGPIELLNDLGRAASGVFNVRPSQDFSLTASPSNATAAQGSTATFIVRATGSEIDPATQQVRPFTQLVNLEVTGIPGGARASFNPENITGEAASTLSLVLPGNIAPGSYSLTIKGKAKVDGKDLERTTGASLTVQVTGQTAISGRVLTTKDEPIMGAAVSLDGKSTTTDAAGAFLLPGVTAGVDRPLMINGAQASGPGRTYPTITEPVTVIAGQTNVIPHNFYLPVIDTDNQKMYVSGQPLEVTTPMAPGLKMMIPAEANLRTRGGGAVVAVSLTCVEPDRPPAPLPPNLGTTMLYTSQPGDVRPAPGVVIPVTYPNLAGADPGTRVELMNFDPDTTRWYRYGYGRVSRDGKLIEPEPGVGLPYFSWHFPNLPDNCDGGECCKECPCGTGNNPVDFSAGLKIEKATDIAFGGARGGLELTRTYTTNLAVRRPGTAFGRGTTHNYDIRLSDPTTTFAEGGAGRIFQPAEVNGRLFSYAGRDARDGALLFTTTATPHQIGDVIRKLTNGTFEYRFKNGNRLLFDSTGRLTGMIDRNGNTNTLTYTGGNLTRITDAVNRSITLDYNGNLISKATDPLGREWKYTYTSGQLATVTDPDNKTIGYGYDGNLGLISVTDKRGTVIKKITYDSNGRVIRQEFAEGGFERYDYELAGSVVAGVTITNALGRVKSMRFNGAGQVIEMVDELGQRSEIKRDMVTNLPLERKGPCGCAEDTRKFDERGNPKEITDQLGKTTFYEYEPAFNNVIKVTDRRGNVTTYTYDTRGNRKTMTNARMETTTYTYDDFGQLKTITDDLGHTVRMEYDNFGNVKERYDGLNNLTKMEYDVVGNLTAILDPLGRRTEMTYDLLYRLKTITDANKARTTYDYDPNGNQILMTDALDHKWMSDYDRKNRLISRTDPLTRTSTMRYNTADEMIAMISPSGRLTTYSYDARGQRNEMRDPLGNSVRFTYDNQRNMTSLTDQRGSTTTFVYDALDRVIARRDPLGFVTKYEYDPEGNVIATVDRLERRTTVIYDKLNRRERVTYVDAVVNYIYDRAGRLTNITDTQGSPIAWAYDNANRLLSETTPQGVVSYTYNIASQRETMTVAPSAPLAARPPVMYGYDEAGRLKTIKQTTETFTYTYDKLSRMMRLERPNNVKTEYSYDEVNRLKRLTHTNALNVPLEDFQYTFNADDEIDSIQSLASATRLPSTTRTANAADAANRIAQFGSASYTFDAEGQTKTKTEADGTDVYEWDARGRLSKVTLPSGQAVNYGYDALGRRVIRAADGVTTNFVYDSQDVVLDRIGSSTVDYLNGLGIDDKLRQTGGNFGTLYFLRDHLGSTAALVSNASGLESAQYEAFGLSAGGSLTRYTFTSRELDSTIGLMYYRARWYEPQQGRFISEDPIGEAGSPNLYSYVDNNPMSWIDPSGLIRLANNVQWPTDNGALESLFCFERCVCNQLAYISTKQQQDRQQCYCEIAVTSGTRNSAGAHGEGKAFDIGINANPDVDRRTAEHCYRVCFDPTGSFAQQEGPDGPHYHYQSRPGRGGATGFKPGIVPNQGVIPQR